MIKKILNVQIKLKYILAFVLPIVVLTIFSFLLISNYIGEKKSEALVQTYRAEIIELQYRNKRYKEQFAKVTEIRDRFRFMIKEMVDLLYNKDSHLSVGGYSHLDIIDATDEAVLLQIRNTIATMEDDQKLLVQVRNYLSARKQFADSFPFIWPTYQPGVPKITSGFGFRENLFGKDKLHFHTGIDIGGARGDAIIATADGIVSHTNYNHPVYGKFLIIQHKYDFVTYYGHLDEIRVGLRKVVKRGDIIGTMGDSGPSQGVHLHYEIRRNDIPLDPMTFLNINY